MGDFVARLMREHAAGQMEIAEDPARLTLECYQTMRAAAMTEATRICRGRPGRRRFSMSRWDTASEAETLPATLIRSRMQYDVSDSLQLASDLTSAVLASMMDEVVVDAVVPLVPLRRQTSDTQPQRPARRASIDRAERQCTWAKTA
jgi:hypothetical protein